MLYAASPAHLGLIRSILIDGAGEGSFDPELATPSAAAALFFANLELGLRSGYLRVPDEEGNLRRDVHIAGYVYSPTGGAPPVGFGVFRELEGGSFELWLTGIAAEARGHGHGHAMLGELLATPAGQMTHVVRCSRRSRSVEAVMRFFGNFGFKPCRDTAAVVWLVNAEAPAELMTRIAQARNFAF